ncbi:hypothetical protein EJB05_37330, partial [Eragrostis curvula]
MRRGDTDDWPGQIERGKRMRRGDTDDRRPTFSLEVQQAMRHGPAQPAMLADQQAHSAAWLGQFHVGVLAVIMLLARLILKMDGMKPYILAMAVQVMYTGMFVIFKATFNHGMNTFVFVFYRQAAASLLLLPVALFFERENARSMTFGLLLKLFFYSLFGITFSSNVQNLGIKFTSGTVAAAIDNSLPVATFCLALLLRYPATMDHVNMCAQMAHG